MHRLDAARLFRLVLESAPTGARLHGAAEKGVYMRDGAAVTGRHLNLPMTAVSGAEADSHFGWLAGFVSLDKPASSTLIQKELGWQPAYPGLVEDFDEGHYFSEPHRSCAGRSGAHAGRPLEPVAVGGGRAEPGLSVDAFHGVLGGFPEVPDPSQQWFHADGGRGRGRSRG